MFPILNKTNIVNCYESVSLAYAVEACVNSLYWISSNPTLLTWIFLFQIDFYDHQNSFYLVLFLYLFTWQIEQKNKNVLVAFPEFFVMTKASVVNFELSSVWPKLWDLGQILLKRNSYIDIYRW